MVCVKGKQLILIPYLIKSHFKSHFKSHYQQPVDK